MTTDPDPSILTGADLTLRDLMAAVRAGAVRTTECRSCGNLIAPHGDSPTGWTHVAENWQGKRCQGGVTGARPGRRYRTGRSNRPMVYLQEGDEPADTDPLVCVVLPPFSGDRVARALSESPTAAGHTDAWYEQEFTREELIHAIDVADAKLRDRDTQIEKLTAERDQLLRFTAWLVSLDQPDHASIRAKITLSEIIARAASAAADGSDGEGR